MGVTIRPAREDELSTLAVLEREADGVFADVGLQQVLDAPVADALTHASARAGGRLLVAEAPGGAVCGFVCIELVDGQAHVEQLSVHPAYAGQRIGARLMSAAERWAASHGHRRMTLCTYRDVPWNGPYYERLGWKPLPDGRLGPELRALRRRERDIGLEVQPRQAMVKVFSVS